MFRIKRRLLLTILVFLTQACQGEPPVGGKTQTASAAQATASAQSTVDTSLTEAAISTVNTNATIAAGTTTAEYQTTQEVLNTQAAATQTAAEELTATAGFIVQETTQALPMLEVVQRLHDEDLVKSIDGTYVRLMDFEDNLAQINTLYPGYPTGFSLENFALQADFSWSSASEKANWDRSGCGFIFGYQDRTHQDILYLSLDGYVKLYRFNTTWKTFLPTYERRYSGNLAVPNGEAEILFVVFDKRVIFYVNGEQVMNDYDGLTVPGDLLFTLISGTNKDYGIRCKMTNVDLWEF